MCVIFSKRVCSFVQQLGTFYLSLLKLRNNIFFLLISKWYRLMIVMRMVQITNERTFFLLYCSMYIETVHVDFLYFMASRKLNSKISDQNSAWLRKMKWLMCIVIAKRFFSDDTTAFYKVFRIEVSYV